MPTPSLFFHQILLFLSLCISTQTFGNTEIDNLNLSIDKAQNDNPKVDKLYQLASEAKHANALISYNYGKQAFDLADSLNYERGKIMGLLTMGESLNYQGKNVESVQMLTEAFKIAEKLKEYKLASLCLRALFYLYFENKNLPKAKYYIREKVKNDVFLDNTEMNMATNFDLQGLVYEEEKKYEQAFGCYKQAANLAHHANDTMLWSTYTSNMAIIFSLQQRYDSALVYHKKAIRLQLKDNDKFRIGYITLWTAKTFLNNNNLDSAMKYVQKGLQLTQNGGPKHSAQLAYEILYKIYRKKKQYDKALSYYEKYIEVSDTIINAEKTKAIAAIENRYQLERKDEDLKLKEHEINNKNLLIYLVLIALCFIIISALILYSKSSVRKRLNMILSDQKIELFEKNQEIEAQNEEISAINKNLEDIVDTRTVQLKESEDLLSMSQSMAKLGSWVLDVQTMKYKWSRQAYEIFEIEEQIEPTFETVVAYMSKDKATELKTKINNAIINATPFEFECKLNTAFGIEKHIYSLAVPVYSNHTDAITRLNGCVQDITERKLAELHLLDQTNALIDSNKKMAEYKLMALQSVMNPHFLFNSLNSIQYFIAKNIKEQALNYLSQFSKLMRLILNNSIQNTITLAQEIEMLKLYTSLETLRFNKFATNFNIEANLEIDNIEIPSLLIQPFVENAILHGLSNLQDESGILDIDFRMQDGKLLCAIEDNGIGRKAAMMHKENDVNLHKSIGMLVTSERINLVSKDELLAINIIDKHDESGNPTGTRVEIVLEINWFE